MDYKYIRPAQVLLDPSNPRLPDGTSNDKEAINRLLDEGFEQMLALARDFATRGEGNPHELPILIKDGSKYVVLEGNRRFAALKLLDDPNWADDPDQQASFRRIKQASRYGEPPKHLYSAIAASRAEVDPWLTLRHTGANSGVGLRTWSADQTARHRRRVKAPIDAGTQRAIAIADELTEAYQADVDLVNRIKKVRKEKLTNIGRFFSADILTRMQFNLQKVAEADSQTLWTKHTADELHGYFEWAFQCLDEKSVDAFKNDRIRGELLNTRADLIPEPSLSRSDYVRLADHPFSLEEGAADSSSESSGAETQGETGGSHGSGHAGTGQPDGNSGATNNESSGGRQRDKPDEKFLYSNVKLSNLSANIQRLLREVKLLPVADNYAAACVLARVILELAVSDPSVLQWSGKKEGDTLEKKINGCILKLDPMIDSPKKRTRQDLTQARLEATEVGVVYLHQFMHNPHAKADAQLARRFSAAFTPLLNSINEAVT